MTYTSKSNSSQNKISPNEIQTLLQTYGIIHTHEYEYKAFSSGKTDTQTSFKEHIKNIFLYVKWEIIVLDSSPKRSK